MKTDLFGYQNQGLNYDIYRPNYPSEMLDKAITVSKQRNTLLDVATGTGKILFHLYPYFKHSKGVDLS
jgi:ubiquinone/menaquinone biosynthesis C-methylase UbiE